MEQALDRIQRLKTNCPKSIVFLLIAQFFFQMVSYGYERLLKNYLIVQLKYQETGARVMLFFYMVLTIVNILFGSYLSDNWFGKCFTVWLSSAIVVVGSTIIAICSMVSFGFMHSIFVTIGVILLSFFGLNCMTSFSCDQFVLPQQQNNLSHFLFFYYFAKVGGELFVTIIRPYIEREPCNGLENCYALLFCSFTVVMILSLIFYTYTASYYVMIEVKKGVVGEGLKCIAYAIKMAFKPEAQKVDNWLDNARKKYDPELVENFRIFVNLSLLLLPFLLYSVLTPLLNQEWKRQSTGMDGRWFFISILPHELPLLYNIIRLIIATCYIFVVPIVKISRSWRLPLTRLVWGAMFATLAFLLTASLSAIIENGHYIIRSQGHSFLRFYNPTNCTADFVAMPFVKRFQLESMGYRRLFMFPKDLTSFYYNLTLCGVNRNSSKISMGPNFSFLYYFADDMEEVVPLLDNIEKQSLGGPKVRTIYNYQPNNVRHFYQKVDGQRESYEVYDDTYINLLRGGEYQLFPSQIKTKFLNGGVYTVLLCLDSTENIHKTRTITVNPPNRISMLYALPQYALLGISDVLIQVSAWEFTYCEAPKDVRVLGPAMFRASIQLGQILFLLLKTKFINIAKTPSILQFVYSGYMVFYTFWFSLVAKYYKCSYFK